MTLCFARKFVSLLAVMFWGSFAMGQNSLTDQLIAESATSLAADVMRSGDAKRGAILFHQVHLQCSKCHSVGDGQSPLGPDLASYEEKPLPVHLLESMLQPSKTIREGFRSVVAVTADGEQVSGILVSEDEDVVTLRDASADGKPRTLRRDELEELSLPPQSLMPEGLLNQLASPGQFYDLARYVIEIAEQGPQRAAELAPPQELIQLPPLPEYESHIDHAAMIADLDDAALDRGRKIYNRVCGNCHGTHQREGSLPTAPRFDTGKLKNGHDPYRMYQTLTHGFGMMVAQRWMVPQQKYDVIHYIRESYFRGDNPELYTKVEADYLGRLPAGDTRGPEPSLLEPYVTMNYGPSLQHTYEIALNNTGEDEDVGWDLGENPRSRDPWANPDEYFQPGQAPNYAYKGIAVRLDPGPGGITRGSRFMVYDHDTMNVQAAWSGAGFIDYSCIQFDGKHNCHNRLTGKIHFQNPVGPGWGQPLTGVFHDPRPVGRDGRPYGPLPSSWAAYKGIYHHGNKTILSYRVGSVDVLESPASRIVGDTVVFARQLSIGSSSHRLSIRLAPAGTHVRLSGPKLAGVNELDGYLTLQLPARDNPTHLQIWISDQPFELADVDTSPPEDLAKYTHGGPARWPEKVRTRIDTIHEDVFAVDEVTLPRSNPWNCQLRPTGHDFFDDNNRAAVCTWDGDVWIVTGLNQDQGDLVWQRIACGLFQPLGLKIVDGQIFVTCRDQLVVLRDLNGDLETDFYECFNSDHQVTEHFHEFAMGLQVGADGSFYYAKSGRHAKRAVVPHHGTLLRISPDGRKTDIIATGFRAANGVCLNPDGSFFVTDQEGHWNPKNRINWVTEGGFYGNMYGFTDQTDSSDEAMLQPLCWITNEFDRSPAELLWVPEDMWGPLGGSLLNLSYGYGKVYVVPHEKVNGQLQGGMCALPIPRFPSGLVRGRFHPVRSDLYVCSMFSWAGSQQDPGGFHRIRYTGRPAHLPLGLRTAERLVRIEFSHAVNESSATDPENYIIRAWDLRRTPNYGSDHYNEREWTVSHARLSRNGRIVTLTVPELSPTWGMSIEYNLEGSRGREIHGEIHNSIYQLRPTSELTARLD